MKRHLYSRAGRKPAFPGTVQAPRVMNRAVPVVENHPGHPDQRVHTPKRFRKGGFDAPDAPGGGERYRGPSGPVEHTGEAARRAEEDRKAGRGAPTTPVRKPRRQPGDEGPFAPGEKWGERAGSGEPTPAQRRRAEREAAREHREAWKRKPSTNAPAPLSWPDTGEQWKGPSGPSESQRSRADEINELTAEINRTSDRAERARLRKRQRDLASEAMHGTSSATPEQRRRNNEQTQAARKRMRSMPKQDPFEGQRYPGAAWYDIVNSASVADTAVVHIYNDIGGEPGSLTAKAFERDLSNVHAGRIDLRLNSRGGDVFDGIAIHNALANHPAKVHVTVDGVAASIASVIAMAGDKITMARGSQMMIHEGFTAMVGNAKDMTKAAALLDKTSDTIAAFYAERAGGTVAQWRDRMRAETWYSAEEAVAAGLADEVAQGARGPRNRMDLSVFNYAGRAAAPAPDTTRAPALQDSWAGLTSSLLAPSNVDSVLATLMEGK